MITTPITVRQHIQVVFRDMTLSNVQLVMARMVRLIHQARVTFAHRFFNLVVTAALVTMKALMILNLGLNRKEVTNG
jgi:hypothetical protein